MLRGAGHPRQCYQSAAPKIHSGGIVVSSLRLQFPGRDGMFALVVHEGDAAVAVLSRAKPYRATSSHTETMPSHIEPCQAMPSHAEPCQALSSCVKLYRALSSCAMRLLTSTQAAEQDVEHQSLTGPHGLGCGRCPCVA